MNKLLVFLICFFFAATAFAANYNVIWDDDGNTEVDGDTFCSGTCQPGDTITLPSGTTNDRLFVRDLAGSSESPIIIQNTSGAQTIIDTNDDTGTAYGFGIVLRNCDHVILDGSNGYTTSNYDKSSPSSYNDYGIQVTDCYYKGIFLVGGSQGVEIRYVEVDNIGGSGASYGIGIDEDSAIGDGVDVDETLSGLHIHHCYIHETKTEGMYLANTGSCTFSNCCDSKDDSDDAVIWDGVEVNDCSFYRTGWDSMSCGCDDDAQIHDNYFVEAGYLENQGVGQGEAISLVFGFGGDVYNNEIYGASKNGILWQGHHSVNIYNNVIANVGTITEPDEDTICGVDDDFQYERFAIGVAGPGTATFNATNNTVISPGCEGFKAYPETTGTAQNNLWVNVGKANVFQSVAEVTNVSQDTVAECNFEDSGSDNYHLTATTPMTIIDSGTTLGSPTNDIDGTSRPQGSGPDMGAYEYSGSSYTIQTTDTTVDGDTFCGGSACASYDTLIIEGGARGSLYLKDFNGNGNYINIQSHPTTQSVITHDDQASVLGCIVIENCQYLNIDGENTSGEDYGIVLIHDHNPNYGGNLYTRGNCDNIKIHGIEAYQTNYPAAANIARIGFQIQSSAQSRSVTLSNFEIYNNYIHDTAYSGMYLGSDDPYTNDDPYVASFNIHDNILEDMGAYGITYKGVNAGTSYIKNNIIRKDNATYSTGVYFNDSNCTALDTPWGCCTGSGTGDCGQFAQGIGTGGYYIGVTSVVVEGNRIEDTYGPGLKIYGRSLDIRDNEILGCGQSAGADWGHGISAYDAKYAQSANFAGTDLVNFNDNIIMKSGGDGLFFHDHFGEYASTGNTMNRNYIGEAAGDEYDDDGGVTIVIPTEGTGDDANLVDADMCGWSWDACSDDDDWTNDLFTFSGTPPPTPWSVSDINILSGALPPITMSGAKPEVSLGEQ